jgi:hypothetical protein
MKQNYKLIIQLGLVAVYSIIALNSRAQTYCSASLHTSVCNSGNNIDTVRIDGTTLNNAHSGCTGVNGNAYTIYSATSNKTGTMQRGNTYNLSVTSTASSIISVWVDFDHSGTFDAAEWTEVTSSSTANVASVASLYIPINAVTGQTGMRIRSRNAGGVNGDINACTSFNSGETEDYTVNIIPELCIPASSDCSQNDITKVLFSNINNTTGCSLDGYAYYSSYSGYSWFPLLVSNIVVGETYPISMTLEATGTTYVAAWIDYNQNGTFDASEYINLGTTIGGTINTNITIPLSATTGYTKMRIRTALTTPLTSGDACLDYSSGETEDYEISIIPVPCTPASTDCSVDDIITNVTFGSISNNTTCSPAGYSSYATPVSTIVQGVAYPVSVTVGPGGAEYVAAWIDYNQNGIFESSEFSTLGTTTGGTVSATITAPLTAVAGKTKMRIRVRYNVPLTDADACIGYNYGETEDYTVIIHVTGDDVCNAIPLSLGTSATYSTLGATVETGEPVPPATGCNTQDGWCNSTLENSIWFSFVAPTSGRVSIAAPGFNGFPTRPGFDAQLAVWNATDCSSILNGSAELVAANDNVTLYNFTPKLIVNCLTPGQTYYLQLDGNNGAAEPTQIILTDLGAIDASFTGLAPSYCSNHGVVTLTPAITGGVFYGAEVTDSLFSPAMAGPGIYVISYVINGCYTTSDTTVVNLTPTVSSTVFPASAMVCAGSSVTLTGTGAVTYTWTGGAITNGVAFVPDSTRTYTVIGTAAGCSNTATKTVTVNQLPAVSLAPFPPFVCNNASAFTLNSGSPVGGIYSGTGVGSGMFSPSFAGNGTYTITYTVTNSNCSNSASQNITVSTCTGIEINSSQELNIYPNPTNGVFDITINNATFSEVLINIVDVQGKEVYHTSAKIVTADYNTRVDLAGLAKGIYYIKLITDTNVMIQKLVVQ